MGGWDGRFDKYRKKKGKTRQIPRPCNPEEVDKVTSFLFLLFILGVGGEKKGNQQGKLDPAPSSFHPTCPASDPFSSFSGKSGIERVIELQIH